MRDDIFKLKIFKRLGSSVGSGFGFWLARYRHHAGLSPLATLAKLLISEEMSNCGNVSMVRQCHLPGCGGFTGYLPAERQALLWHFPTTRQSAYLETELLKSAINLQ